MEFARYIRCLVPSTSLAEAPASRQWCIGQLADVNTKRPRIPSERRHTPRAV